MRRAEPSAAHALLASAMSSTLPIEQLHGNDGPTLPMSSTEPSASDAPEPSASEMRTPTKRRRIAGKQTPTKELLKEVVEAHKCSLFALRDESPFPSEKEWSALHCKVQHVRLFGRIRHAWVATLREEDKKELAERNDLDAASYSTQGFARKLWSVLPIEEQKEFVKKVAFACQAS